MDLKNAIANSYIARGLSPAEVDAVAAIAEQRTFPGGATMVRQFEKSSDLMIIMDGRVRINTFSGERIVEVGPGAVTGEIALLDDKPRSATVMSVGGTTVAIIPAAKLKALWQTDPNIELVFLRNLSHVLCDHIRLANMQLEGLVR